MNKGINKRECRKYSDPGLTFRKNDGILFAGQIKYVVRTAVKNIAGRRVLVVYFYDREKAAAGCNVPEYTLFQCKDDYITFENGAKKWRTASLDNLGDSYTYFTRSCAFYKQNDEQRVIRFCNNSGKSGFDALEYLQRKVMEEKLRVRILERERKIVNRMRSVPPTPRDLKGWIHREDLPHYIFYEYHRSKQPMSGYCTACRHDVLTIEAKHNTKGVCPRCKKDITYKASGVAKRVWDRLTVQVVQKSGDSELILRIFKVSNGLRDWREPYFSVWENARIFLQWNEAKEICAEAYYNSYTSGTLTKWKKGERPRLAHYQYNFECDFCGYLYCRNLDAALAGTPWQYSQLKSFSRHLENEPFEVIPYLRAYNRYPAIEYLVKLGLGNLAAQIVYEHDGEKIINTKGRNLREVLGIEATDLPMLQRLNVTVHQMELYHAMKKQGIRMDENLLDWYRRFNIMTTEDVLHPLRYTTPSRLMRYADEQYDQLIDIKTGYGARRYDRPSRILSEYNDYLRIGTALEYDFLDSFVLFPRNLMEAHDQASKMFDKHKRETCNKQIREAFKRLTEQYHFENDGFMLIAPKTAREIVSEGHALHHCVHTYVERVAKGQCIILFVRKTDSPKEPFFTVELRNNKVTQTRGQGNCAPTPEVEKFLSLWERERLQPVLMAA